jgi:virulence-associated protein VagC
MTRETVVFKNGNSAAVRLLGECGLPRGTRVREYREGTRIVVEPIGGWPRRFLAALGAYPDEIPRPADPGRQRDPFARPRRR